MKSGNLNFLEPSGPLQACNGTALPLPTEGEKQYVQLNTAGGHRTGGQLRSAEHLQISPRDPKTFVTKVKTKGPLCLIKHHAIKDL